MTNAIFGFVFLTVVSCSVRREIGETSNLTEISGDKFANVALYDWNPEKTVKERLDFLKTVGFAVSIEQDLGDGVTTFSIPGCPAPTPAIKYKFLDLSRNEQLEKFKLGGGLCSYFFQAAFVDKSNISDPSDSRQVKKAKQYLKVKNKGQLRNYDGKLKLSFKAKSEFQIQFCLIDGSTDMFDNKKYDKCGDDDRFESW